MEISKEAKSELKVIYQNLIGEQLSDQEAENMAQDLFCLFDAIYHPLPEKQKPNN